MRIRFDRFSVCRSLMNKEEKCFTIWFGFHTASRVTGNVLSVFSFPRIQNVRNGSIFARIENR